MPKQQICEQKNQRLLKSTSLTLLKTERAMKLLIMDSDNHKQFKRKQQINLDKYKNKYEDIGKLISNTSFGSCPDIKKIVSTSPKSCLQLKPEQAQANNKKYQQNGYQSTLRQKKSIAKLQKIIKPNPKLLTSMQKINLNKNEIKAQNNTQNQFPQLITIVNKYSKLLLQHKQLQQKYTILHKKYQKIQIQLLQKQQAISQYNIDIIHRIQQQQNQRQINIQLQNIVVKLNIKIEQLLKLNKQNQYNKQYNKYKNYQNHTTIQSQNTKLRQQIYQLNKIINSLEVEKIVLKKLRHQLEKQKNNKKCLEKQVRGLKQKLLALLKNNKNKSPKISLKNELDYSVSFSFD